jgi:hypothetical protein
MNLCEIFLCEIFQHSTHKPRSVSLLLLDLLRSQQAGGRQKVADNGQVDEVDLVAPLPRSVGVGRLVSPDEGGVRAAVLGDEVLVLLELGADDGHGVGAGAAFRGADDGLALLVLAPLSVDARVVLLDSGVGGRDLVLVKGDLLGAGALVEGGHQLLGVAVDLVVLDALLAVEVVHGAAGPVDVVSSADQLLVLLGRLVAQLLVLLLGLVLGHEVVGELLRAGVVLVGLDPLVAAILAAGDDPRLTLGDGVAHGWLVG